MPKPAFPALEDKRRQLKEILTHYGVRGPNPTPADLEDVPLNEIRDIHALNNEIGELQAMQRAAHDALASGGGERGAENGGQGFPAHKAAATPGGTWAAKAVDALSAEARRSGVKALTTGSVDIPSLLNPSVVPLPTNAARLIDLLPDRRTLQSNEYEYLRQVDRTNNAAPVPDHVQKPQSTFTVEPITDRARVIAHLSEPFPTRFFVDHRSLLDWLESEMFNGVMDELEEQLVNGSGVGENMTGVLNTPGVLVQAYNTSILATLRKARTRMENLREMPNAWILSPTDMETIDLLQAADGDFLAVAGWQHIFGDIPRIVSPSVPAGTALLGDWRQAVLFTRENMRLDADGSGEYFKRNEAIMRAEGRFGIAVTRPQAFCEIDLTP